MQKKAIQKLNSVFNFLLTLFLLDFTFRFRKKPFYSICQVVRGKVTTRCLWHACKALGIGLLLMLLGACMATIGKAYTTAYTS